jgi:hypothetical protein
VAAVKRVRGGQEDCSGARKSGFTGGFSQPGRAHAVPASPIRRATNSTSSPRSDAGRRLCADSSRETGDGAEWRQMSRRVRWLAVRSQAFEQTP